MGKLFFIGDSITTGAWDASGGWANRLIGDVMAKTIKANDSNGSFYCMPYNLGVSGDSAVEILRRMTAEITPRCDNENPNEKKQIVFATGVNDSWYWFKPKRSKVTDEAFAANIQKLIDEAHAFTTNISFIGILPVVDELLNPLPWAPEISYANVHVERFENIIRDVCAQNNLPFLPLYQQWHAMPDYADYLQDGVHPNSRGHDLLYSQIKAFLLTPEFIEFHS